MLVYVTLPDRDRRNSAVYQWMKAHRDDKDISFWLYPEGVHLSKCFDEMNEAIRRCDVHVAFAVSRWEVGSCNTDIELQSSLYKHIPIIIIRLSPDDAAVGRLTIDEMSCMSPGCVRVFDMTAGEKAKALPAFIRKAVEDCKNAESDDYFADAILEQPYEGDLPYLFVSYSHKDRDKVYPVISRMQKDGYRIWYDEGIHAASQWDEFIARHISDCSYMLAFISPNYIESSNCKDEISFARDLNKKRLLIYLEQTKLPLGLSMRLKRLQAINKYECKTGSEFYEKLVSADGIEAAKA